MARAFACGRWCGCSSHQVAVAVALRLQRRCLRRRAGAPGVGSVAPPRSRRRDARTPPLSWRRLALCAVRIAQRLKHLRVVVGAATYSQVAVAVAQRSRRRCPRRRAVAPAPAQSCRRPAAAWRSVPLFCSDGSLSERCVVLSGLRFCVCLLARWLPLIRWWSPSRCAHGAAACGAALALLAPAQSCRRTRGGVLLGGRSSAAAARSPCSALCPAVYASTCGR